eukprot:2245508-Pleurochrysis_carterae.AAC.1
MALRDTLSCLRQEQRGFLLRLVGVGVRPVAFADERLPLQLQGAAALLPVARQPLAPRPRSRPPPAPAP